MFIFTTTIHPIVASPYPRNYVYRYILKQLLYLSKSNSLIISYEHFKYSSNTITHILFTDIKQNNKAIWIQTNLWRTYISNNVIFNETHFAFTLFSTTKLSQDDPFKPTGQIHIRCPDFIKQIPSFWHKLFDVPKNYDLKSITSVQINVMSKS